MKKTTLLLSMAFACLVASCTPAVSVRPLHSDEDKKSPIGEPRIEGNWISPDVQPDEHDKPVAVTWKVTRNSSGSYSVEVRSVGDEQGAEQSVTRYDVWLVSLDGKFFFDADFEQTVHGKLTTAREDLELGTVPAHVIGRVRVEPNFLVVNFLSSDWVRDNTPEAFREFVSLGGKTDVAIITGTTPDLRKFMVEQAENAEAFGYVRYLCRPETDCVASAYEDMLKKAPADEEILGAAVGHFLQAGNYERAVKLLRRASETKPKDASRKDALGNALLLQRDYEGARREFSLAQELLAGDLDAEQGIGWSYFLEGNFEKAATAFRKSVDSAERKSAEPALLAYVALKRSGKSTEAEALLSKEVAEFKGEPEDQLLMLLFARRITSYPYQISEEAKNKSRAHLFAAEKSLADGNAAAAPRNLWECVVQGSKDSLYAAAAKVELERLSAAVLP